ncbi:hypothetical protein MMC27_003769 [Xylographa pallens]|nr:hypothetical protein [Xylographa pallens]
MGLSGQHGAQTWTQRPDYKTYQSPYGPGYSINKNFHGIDLRRATKLYVIDFLHIAGVKKHERWAVSCKKDASGTSMLMALVPVVE